MTDCDNCLCHLKICKAECCKQFKVTLTKNVRVFKGMELGWMSSDEDLLYYYKLHGCVVNGNKVYLKLDKFEKNGKELIIHNTCMALTDDNLCYLHNTSKQPKICTYPNKTGTGEKVYLTPNCVFKKTVIES